MKESAAFKDARIEALEKELEKTKNALENAKELLKGVLIEIEKLNYGSN